MSSTFGMFVGALLVGMGALVGWFGWRQHSRHALVAETPTTEARTIDEEGLVELKGEADAEETFLSPVGDDESVLSAWEIEEWDERGESESWETRATGVYARPFALDDGTGSVDVEVGDHVEGEYTGRIEMSVPGVDVDRVLSTGVSAGDVFAAFDPFPVETTVPPDGDPPEHITEFLQGEAEVDEQTNSITNVVDVGTSHGERRYYEATVEPGQEIYLLGEAQAKPDATYPLGPDDVVVRPPASGDGVMVVSDQSEEDLLSELGRYRWAYAASVVLALVGLGVVVWGAGLV